MQKLKNIAYGTIGGISLLAQQTFAAIDFKGTNVDARLQGSTDTVDVVIKNWISWAAKFLYILAVIYGLYGGWTIMTAGGDEKKVGTGKNIIIRAVIGLIVIFLANSIVSFVIDALFGGK